MITFQGNKTTLHSAKMLERNAKNIYPHISTSRLRTQIGFENPDPPFFTKIKNNYSLVRQMIRKSGDIPTELIYSLKYGGIGNCTEDAIFTEILGKINGQMNIHTGSLGIVKDGKKGVLNHVVAFLTDKQIEAGKAEFFKNKDAIVIDPWLGVTDFVGNYFTKLKTVYRKLFMQDKSKRFATFSNDNLAIELAKESTKTPEEFKKLKKEIFSQTDLSIIPFRDSLVDREKIKMIRASFPELILENFKKISLSKKTKTM